MRSLFIDTSSFFMMIAVIEDDKILYKFHKEIKNDMASQIVPKIEMAFNEVNFEIKDIDKIFVVNGPGSFTGVRIGVTAAKVIGWSLNKVVVPISSLEFLATTPTHKLFLVPLIDARRGNVYAAVYDNKLNVVEKDALVNLDSFIKDKTENYEFISYDEIPNTIKPNQDILKIIEKHENDKGVCPHSLKPNYLKLTEAEESRL